MKEFKIFLKRATLCGSFSILSLIYSLFSEELPNYLPFINFSTSTTIPKYYTVFGYNYGLLNDKIDILNLKQKFSNNFSTNIGNYKHNKIWINFGLSDSTMIMGYYNKRNIDYGLGKLNITSYSYSFKKSFNSIFSIEIGIKENRAKNIKFYNINTINYYISKFKKKLIIENEKKYMWITRKYPDMVISIGFLKIEEPYFSLEKMNDKTNYYKFIFGKAFENFYPNIFFEYGKTKVNTQINSNILKMIPERFKNILPKLPYKLNRREKYFKFGLSLLIKTPFRTLTNIEYNYIHLSRNSTLNYIDYNHILKGNIFLFLNRHLILSFGGKLLYRQFNGEIPFLYNKYTQTTFDHPYGWVEFGVILRFD